jgi:HlyD family secretion protein
MSPDPPALPATTNSTLAPALVVEPPPRRRLRGLVVVTALVLVAASGTWAWSNGSLKRLLGDEETPIPLVEVDRGSLMVYLVETGALESANNTSIKCQVESLLGTTGGTAGTGRTGSTGSSTQGGAGGTGSGGSSGGASTTPTSSTGSSSGATKKAGVSTAKKGSTASANSKTATSSTSTATKSTASAGASSSSSSSSSSASSSTGTTSSTTRPTIKSFSYDVAKHVPLRGAATTKSTQAKTTTAASTAMTGGGGGGGRGGGGGGRGGGGGGGRGGMGGQEEKAGSTRIIWVKPEGSDVKADEVVCELDSAAFRDELAAQKIRWLQAKSWVEQAKEIYELNVLIDKEYREGIYPQDLNAIQEYIQNCETAHERAIKTEAWSRDVYEKRFRASAQYEADKDTVEQTALALHEARRMLDRLVKYTGPRLKTAMRAKLEAIRADRFAQEYSFQVEDDRLRRIQRMIDNCTIKAPADGVLVYNNQTNGWSGQVEMQIQEGVTVREGQTLFDLPDPKRMRVKVKINESRMASVHPGQKAEVAVEAFPGKVLRGTVAEITAIPSVQNRFSDIKIYFAIVNIETGFEGLRPGMTTEVSFLIGDEARVTRVPVRSLRWAGGQAFVAVGAKVDGETKWDWRPVTLGLLDPQFAEVKSGVEPGEKVVADPSLLPAPDLARYTKSPATPNQTASAPAPSHDG